MCMAMWCGESLLEPAAIYLAISSIPFTPNAIRHSKYGWGLWPSLLLGIHFGLGGGSEGISGLFVGILGMVPRWWSQRRAATRAGSPALEVPAEQNLPGNARPHGL